MYSLYEGSVKIGFDSETVYELLDRLPDDGADGEGEYGPQEFHGRVYAYDREDWADWIYALSNEDDGYLIDDLEDGDTVEGLLAGWLKDRRLPRELSAGQIAVCVMRAGDLEERWRMFDGDPEPEAVNEMLSWCAPDYGYRVVRE